jgi:hypothetical protein
MVNDNVPPSRGRRPLAVWLLCLGNALIAIILIATAFLAERRGYSAGLAALYGFTGLAMSIAAHATWYGNRWGRRILLTLITVYFGNVIGYWAWAIVQDAADGLFHDRLVTAALLRIGLSLVWIGLNYIFLFSNRARVFFA